MSRYRSSVTPPGFETAYTVGPDHPAGRYLPPPPRVAEADSLYRGRARAMKAARIARHLTVTKELSFNEVMEAAQDPAWREQMTKEALGPYKTASEHTWAVVAGFLEATMEEPW